MRVVILCLVLLSLALIAQAQPAIRAASVVNAANNLPTGLPNAGLAQGGMFILKGRNLGARGTVVANSFPLGTTMGGTSMKITVGGTTVNVIMVYVVGGLPPDDQGPFDQLAAIVPSNTPTGSGTLTVTFNNQTSAPVAVTVLASAFGIFSINQAGTGPGVFTDPNFKVSTLVNAAHANDQLFIWGTGLGAISGSDANAPPVGNLNVPVEVYVGGVKAAIGYQGRSGCCSGIDQILITIPAGVQGCYVSVVVKTGNVVSNTVTMSIASSGNTCSDGPGFAVSELQNATGAITVGDIELTRFSAKFSFPGQAFQGNVDFGSGRFPRFSANALLGSRRGANALGDLEVPSAGCTVLPFQVEDQGELFSNILNNGHGDGARGVDAGVALNFTGPVGARQVLRQNNGGDFNYELPGDQVFGGGIPPVIPASPEYLAPGAYTVTNGSGGAEAGGFSANLTIPSFTNPWANQDAINAISHSQDLTLTLNPVTNDLLTAVVGSSADPSKGWGATFACIVPPGATSVAVPVYVLSALPASGLASDVPGARLGFLAVGVTLANPGRFQARGIDTGHFTFVQALIKNVNFQ